MNVFDVANFFSSKALSSIEVVELIKSELDDGAWEDMLVSLTRCTHLVSTRLAKLGCSFIWPDWCGIHDDDDD